MHRMELQVTVEAPSYSQAQEKRAPRNHQIVGGTEIIKFLIKFPWANQPTIYLVFNIF